MRTFSIYVSTDKFFHTSAYGRGRLLFNTECSRYCVCIDCPPLLSIVFENASNDGLCIALISRPGLSCVGMSSRVSSSSRTTVGWLGLRLAPGNRRLLSFIVRFIFVSWPVAGGSSVFFRSGEVIVAGPLFGFVESAAGLGSRIAGTFVGLKR